MVSPRALQLAQNNYDISNASSAKPSPKLQLYTRLGHYLGQLVAITADTDMSGKLTN